MMLPLGWLLVIGGVLGFLLPYRKARAQFHAQHNASSLPVHGGFYGLTNTLLLAFIVWIAWTVGHQPIIFNTLEPYYAAELHGQSFWKSEVLDALRSNNSPNAVIASIAADYARLFSLGQKAIFLAIFTCIALGLTRSLRQLHAHISARACNERRIGRLLQGCAIVSIAITVLIFLSVITEAVQFFRIEGVWDFLSGTEWSPQTAIREGQAGASGTFGFLPLLIGTLMITVIALTVAVPIGLFTAIYLNEYASPSIRRAIKPMLEVLAGIPTVVYGFFAITTMTPLLQTLGVTLGVTLAAESALAAGIVMGVMLIPLVSSMSDDAIKAVPRALRDASLALGATRSETMKHAILPTALGGIVGGILLATSRAMGETMIVVMAAGLSANFTFNPLESVTTITVQIVALLGGDQDFASQKTLAAFALGLTLFLFTLCLNIIALIIVRRYKQTYE
jgi:phosphate transport system permease protein